MAKETKESKDENAMHHHYLLGQAVAIEGIVARLRGKAGELFARGGNDEKASTYRDLARELEPEAAKLRIVAEGF